jgi:hypothetical protein
MFVGIYVLYNILPNGSYQIEVFKIKRGVIRFGLIRSKKSYFFEYEEIKKPLQVPERLGLLKAQK